jgi:hypothetical protein
MGFQYKICTSGIPYITPYFGEDFKFKDLFASKFTALLGEILFSKIGCTV